MTSRRVSIGVRQTPRRGRAPLAEFKLSVILQAYDFLPDVANEGLLIWGIL